MARNKRLSKEEYAALVREWKKWDAKVATTKRKDRRERYTRNRTRAADKIMRSMEFLLQKRVRKLVRHCPEKFEDCLSETRIAILRSALPGYDEAKSNGASFSTYAVNWVRNSVQRFLDADTPVRVPYNEQRKIAQHFARNEEIPEELEAYNIKFSYGDETILPIERDPNGTARFDLLAHTKPNAEEKFAHNRLREALETAINKLPGGDVDKMVARSMLCPSEPTNKSIGDKLGVTRQAVSIRHKKVIGQLRRLLGKDAIQRLL